MEKVEAKEINYDVANALYLMSKRLGENYEREKVSPFSDNFSLRSDFALSVIKSGKKKKDISLKPFLENGNKQVSENFKLSLENVNEAILGLEEKLKSGEFAGREKENIEEEVLTCIDFLNARKKLLELAIEELKNLRTDSFEIYKEIVSLNEDIEQILDESFEKKLEKEILIQQFIDLQRKNKKKAIFTRKSEKNHEIIKEKENISEINYQNKYENKSSLKPLNQKENEENLEQNNGFNF